MKIALIFAIAAASLTEGATIILNPLQQARVSDESVIHTTSDTVNLLVSDSSGSATFVSSFHFGLGGNVAEVAAASSITFSITLAARLGAATGVRLVAFNTDDNVAAADDFDAAGTLVAFIADSEITVGVPLVFDITSFAKADALFGSSYTSYRLEREINTNNGNAAADGYTFGILGTASLPIPNATLTIIPETSSALLGSLTVLGLLLRRRR